MEKRNRYTPEFKTKVVLEVLQEEQTVNEIAAKYELNPVMISRWKAEFLARASMVFEKGTSESDKLRKEYESKQEHLEKLVGQLTVEIDWLKKNLALNKSAKERQTMIEHDHPTITIKRQAWLLGVNRTSAYRKPKESTESAENIQIMHEIDAIYTDKPFFGYRRITATLRAKGFKVNRKRVRRLMRLMGIHGIHPQPNLSKRLHAKYVRPYLLRGLDIQCPNHVWGVDITYIRMGKGFMYLFAIIDWFSRKVIDYELSSTLEKGFVLTCLKRAFSRRKPAIMNSDQGSHFTNADYLELLAEHQIQVSMDGKGRATDNSRTERFFRALKYECIYLNEFENPRELRKGLARYVTFYNTDRPHQSLNYATPGKVYSQHGNTAA
ncbi:IS3 family transposase [Bacillus sp. P2(2020)]|uniref:IS3 family transposase n=1 Tax=Calidifontibacillus erzurumensis TaxID=2741433 RepID=A0A8J8KBH4_9BACI|nr:IS3 family transposase [Calidifontibacillus erzurumensis]NSL51939.1 IS3 family transposase [Calidifontibacillus erzurumensis]